ncbi:MAG: hypothetical protein GPJ05_15825 [Microcystis aeruginosa G13-10]|nr:hypothetical protein [Microcystis aeruginosa G13-10]
MTAVTLTRTNGSDGAVSVIVNLTNGTATAPSDYNNTPITVNFANGETSKTVNIPIVNDTQFEPDETVNLSLSNPTGGATLGTKTTAVLTIINDDLPQRGAISLNSSSYTVNENGTPSINLLRTGGSDGEVSATLNLTDGTATAGNDYIQTPITVIFADGETSKTVNLTQANQGLSFNGVSDYASIPDSDAIDFDTNENFTVEAWIKADPNQVDFGPSQFDNVIIEKWSGFGSYPFVIRYANGSGLIAGARYDGSNNPSIVSKTKINDGIFHHIAFAKNGAQLSLYVDGNIEGTNTDNTVRTTRNTSPLFLGRRGGSIGYFFKGAIDDLRIWNKARTQAEIQADFNRELTGNESGLVGYWNFNSVNGNTVQDLSSNNNDGTFVGAQSTTGFSTSLIIDDNIYEPTETVNLTLSNPTGGATLGTQQTATLTIIDNDAVPGVIQFSNGTYSVNENGTPVTAVTLTRTNGSDGAVSVRINLTNGTATAPSDYNNTQVTVNFANGETSKTVNIPIVNDTQFEPDETVNLSLFNPTGGATLGTQTTAVLTILNDDLPQPGRISLNNINYTVNENGTANITLTRHR